MSAILRAPVDLLYNGGIGTYVKASDETHAEVGDRANDALRIDATELRCKVVAEGGNLGFTQRGRIEYARAGGRINTDAIDNSGGVDTSDHEVNIKILLDLPVAEGVLTTKQRNEFLATMTDDVAALVLADNYEQTEILSVGRRLAPRLLDDEARFMRFLEREGRLHRAIEFLPADDVLAERAASGEGLATPERAVLLAYAKLWLYDEILASKLPDDPWVAKALVDYFPPALVERYGAFLPRHPLRREIIANVVVNRTINRAGATFVHRMREATGASPAEVVRAHMLAREVFALPAVWRDIESLDMQVADDVQAAMLIDTGRLATRGTLWFLRSPRLAEDMASTIARFGPGVASLAERVFDLLPGASREEALRRATELESARVPEAARAPRRHARAPFRRARHRRDRGGDGTGRRRRRRGALRARRPARARLAVAADRGAARRRSLAGTGAGRAARRRRRVAARADDRRAARGSRRGCRRGAARGLGVRAPGGARPGAQGGRGGARRAVAGPRDGLGGAAGTAQPRRVRASPVRGAPIR